MINLVQLLEAHLALVEATVAAIGERQPTDLPTIEAAGIHLAKLVEGASKLAEWVVLDTAGRLGSADLARLTAKCDQAGAGAADCLRGLQAAVEAGVK